MTTLFISDIHLGEEHPEISQRFVEFLRHETAGIKRLYILGDLFEAWIGDDAIAREYRQPIESLKNLSTSGVPIDVMVGNRDFLLGQGFEKASGCRLISDPTIIDLYGEPTLLMHGDTLCTDDSDYQDFRRLVRSHQWQQNFLAMPIEQRQSIARQYRNESQTRTKEKSVEITDVNKEFVARTMQQHNVRRLIHGHTHRPKIHKFDISGEKYSRIVLGDWYEQNSILVCDEKGFRLLSSTN